MNIKTAYNSIEPLFDNKKGLKLVVMSDGNGDFLISVAGWVGSSYGFKNQVPIDAETLTKIRLNQKTPFTFEYKDTIKQFNSVAQFAEWLNAEKIN